MPWQALTTFLRFGKLALAICAPLRCNVVHKNLGLTMVRPRQTDSPAKIRTSVSLPADEYVELERIAADKRASLAWVVRDAVRRYLEARAPLLHQNAEEESQK